MKKTFFFVLVLIMSCSFVGVSYAQAEELKTVITSDSLEYRGDIRQFHATGSVLIERDGTSIKSDDVTYSEDTSDVIAIGNVIFEDKEADITASRVELNLEKKTGRLFDAKVFFRKTNYHLYGQEIEKQGEKYYSSPEATITTCDSPVPEWCFKGRKINAELGDSMKSRNATFNIRDLPVFYFPFVWISLDTERHTGFLIPTASFSKTRGAGLNLPFFWAISQDKDATFVFDTYSKRGVGTGIEYRFVKDGGIRSAWWLYHISDGLLDKKFWEFRAMHEQRHSDSLGGFLSVNYVSQPDFYREYSPYLKTRILRYVESTAEISLPLDYARVYALGQYWVDLIDNIGQVPQKLPEAGYVLNDMPVGGLLLSTSLNASRLASDKGLSSDRIDFYPMVRHSMGSDFVFSQMLALRETYYSYSGPSDAPGDLRRDAFEYDAVGHVRLEKSYGSFIHVVEPSVRYHFISTSENNLPVMDSPDLFGKTSQIEFSVLNRAIVKGRELMLLRVTQPIDTYNHSRPFMPLEIELGIREPLAIKADMTFDVHTGQIETASSDLTFNISGAQLRLGERYNRANDIIDLKAELQVEVTKAVSLAGHIYYDAKADQVNDMSLRLRYMKQCWGVRLEAIKKPGDFTVLVLFELVGVKPVDSKKTSEGAFQTNSSF